jgi:hypothetical protein
MDNTMKYTNKHGIPEELAAAIQVDHYSSPDDKPYDYSVTKLLSPIQQTELLRRYKDSDKLPEMDVLDGFNAWVGSVIHNSIEDAWKKGMQSIAEERLYMKIGGKTLSGKLDCLDYGNKKIIDWKTCRLYKVQKGDYLEWERQQNLYAMLCDENGYDINDLEIVAIMLDWKKNEAKFKNNYPQTPIVPIQLNKWSKEEAVAFAKDRIQKLERAKKMTDEELSVSMSCSRYDQWSQYQGTALIKEGNTKATKVFESREQAEDYVNDNPKFKEYNLEDRYSKRTRCMDYCSAKPVCQQYKREVAEENGITKPKLKI